MNMYEKELTLLAIFKENPNEEFNKSKLNEICKFEITDELKNLYFCDCISYRKVGNTKLYKLKTACSEKDIEKRLNVFGKEKITIFNKVFTGKYLVHNLGHEIINFIKCDDDKHYVYINPWGNINYQPKLKYAFHIIEVNKKDENQVFELVGISVINPDQSNSIYNIDVNKEDE